MHIFLHTQASLSGTFLQEEGCRKPVHGVFYTLAADILKVTSECNGKVNVTPKFKLKGFCTCKCVVELIHF